jgi:serine/threonine protein kinase
MTGRVRTESPNIYQLLQFQAEKMQKVKDPALVKVDKIVHTNNICYYQMEYVSGQTLRELMDKDRVPIRVIIEIALALDRLSQNPNFRYHGDLKPENIIINDTSIKLIDIGYFGCEEKSYSSTIITTPAYYPDLQPDDLFALGLIIWEIACHQQPFSLSKGSSEFLDLSNIGENLFEWVYHSELLGHYFKSPILYINRPTDICSDISPLLEDFLLKVINLYIKADNKIDRKLHFKTFPQLANALEDLIEAGITHL